MCPEVVDGLDVEDSFVLVYMEYTLIINITTTPIPNPVSNERIVIPVS
jgi:hypothetical protein